MTTTDQDGTVSLCRRGQGSAAEQASGASQDDLEFGDAQDAQRDQQDAAAQNAPQALIAVMLRG